MDLTTLVTGGEAHLHGYCLRAKGKGLAVERRKDYDYKSLAYTFGGRRMEPFLITVPPKDESQLSFNSHPGQEFIHMLSGRLEITLDNSNSSLAEGDSFYFSSSIPHALRGLDGKEAVFVDVLAFAKPPAAREPFEKGSLDPAKLLEWGYDEKTRV